MDTKIITTKHNVPRFQRTTSESRKEKVSSRFHIISFHSLDFVGLLLIVDTVYWLPKSRQVQKMQNKALN